ncbi:hypothetical protein F511_07885 [Dorcoceras hygrometricum]|uniref:Plant basic secretory protein (BSP) family protein n=1 Tax=Dorcoceras hygrometricum TaxID=472368 RepID=A0A2Z7AL46_9LAMI|nr:hypothetical protein F511_07885 [Dorcoceras hygrometricum]
MGKGLHKFICISFFLVVAALVHEVCAVRYIVTNNARNTPGGARFDREIGVTFTKQVMEVINNFVWRILEQHTTAERKNVPVLNLFISDFPGPIAYTNGDNINFSSRAIENFPPGKVFARFHFCAIMYHEMTHIFQWSGNRTAPGGLTEGVADYVMVKSNFYARPYPKPGLGSRWDEGYAVTERFLEYCDSLRPGFTVALNKMMRYSYSDNYFKVLLGKPVDQLWRDYKAKYA